MEKYLRRLGSLVSWSFLTCHTQGCKGSFLSILSTSLLFEPCKSPFSFSHLAMANSSLINRWEEKVYRILYLCTMFLWWWWWWLTPHRNQSKVKILVHSLRTYPIWWQSPSDSIIFDVSRWLWRFLGSSQTQTKVDSSFACFSEYLSHLVANFYIRFGERKFINFCWCLWLWFLAPHRTRLI